MNTSAQRERARNRQQIRRQTILEAAAAEFAEVGYDAATLERIGDRVGLSKGSLYYYVDNKQQLLAALLDETVTRIQRAAALPEGASPAQRLRAFVRAHVEASVATAEGKVLAENLDALMARSASTELAELREGHERFLTDILVEGIATGDFREVRLRPIVKLLFGALNGVPQWFDPDGAMSPGELADETVDLLMAALTPQARPSSDH